MRVALICTDKPGALQIRMDNRPAHLAYIQSTGVVEMAGPFLDEAGNMTGSLIILSVDTLEAAEGWAERSKGAVPVKVVVPVDGSASKFCA